MRVWLVWLVWLVILTMIDPTFTHCRGVSYDAISPVAFPCNAPVAMAFLKSNKINEERQSVCDRDCLGGSSRLDKLPGSIIMEGC